MLRRSPVAHWGVGRWCWWCTLFAGSGVRMFLWGQRPWKRWCMDRLWTLVLSLSFWLIWRGGGGTILAVLSGANRGRRGALKLSRGPISGYPRRLAAIHTAGLIGSDVGYVLFTYMCVCVCVHSWDGGNCVSVFTPWLKISLPLHLTADWFDLAATIHLFHQLPPRKKGLPSQGRVSQLNPCVMWIIWTKYKYGIRWGQTLICLIWEFLWRRRNSK